MNEHASILFDHSLTFAQKDIVNEKMKEVENATSPK